MSCREITENTEQSKAKKKTEKDKHLELLSGSDWKE